MPWKRDDNGNLALDEENNPIRVDAEGKEYPFGDSNLDGTLSKLEKLNRDEAGYRKTAEQLKQKLKPLEDIEDVETWRSEADKAMKTMQNLKDKDLVDANEVENLKKQLSESYEKKIQEKDQALQEKDSLVYNLMVSQNFAKSQALENTVLPPDVAEAYFGKHFKIEDGQVVGYLGNDKIYSKQNPGQLATFDEALTEIIDQYPMKDRILKGPAGGSGSNSTPANSGHGVKAKKDLRTAKDKAKYISKHGQDAYMNLPAE